ncbi:hypothetical protein SCUCBS95973_002980 [Sporothrix curviconia]|uniref:Thymidylate kinase n=1 Tax=Sporothrix curviconia TaxID=1260050 RepID=A0ABP0BBM2_9PEZI
MARQPFAPLDGARLQALTSTKNRQNAVQPLASKRKAAVWSESEDTENVDPHLSAKRSKGVNGSNGSNNSNNNMLKKPAFTLTKASLSSVANIFDAKPSSLSTSPRAVLKPRAPSTKMSAKFSSTSPIRSPMTASSLPSSLTSTPSFSSLAGRSPIRASRRGGLLTSKRRASSGLARASSASSNFGASAPFSLDAALKGTLSSFDARLAASALPTTSLLDETTGLDASWEFTIHEDTPEQEMTNLLQHSTCVLDISSDEESEQKAKRERAEGRDKENIPPPNDVSQTSTARSEHTAAAAVAVSASSTDEMSVDKARNPLSQLNAADFYAEGCDEASVVLVASDETEEELPQPKPQHETQERLSLAALLHEESPVETETAQAEEIVLATVATVATVETVETIEVPEVTETAVEDIMSNRENPACAAALLEPIEGTGESFQLWESGSQKDDDL